MSVDWTWAAERTENGEILDTIECESYADAVEQADFHSGVVVLVCDTCVEGVNSRGWAYIVGCELEAHASDAYGDALQKTTKRHRKEVSRTYRGD